MCLNIFKYKDFKKLKSSANIDCDQFLEEFLETATAVYLNRVFNEPFEETILTILASRVFTLNNNQEHLESIVKQITNYNWEQLLRRNIILKIHGLEIRILQECLSS